MANRHLARTIALQALYEWDFAGSKRPVEEIVSQDKKEFAPDFDDQGFSLELAKSVIEHQKEIDALIARFAPEWPLDQITTTDRNVLRLGIYELKLSNEIPPKVAINEAIELAKAFGGDASGKFVNGVLGSIYKEMIKQGEKQSLTSQGIKEVSAGGVIYRAQGSDYRFVLILDAYDKWTFPKGHVDDGEKVEVAAIREIQEETGLQDLKLKDYLGDTEVKVHRPEEKPFRKLIKYYLVEAKDEKLVVPETTELKDVQWFDQNEVIDKLGYENAKEIFALALQKLGL